MLKLVNDRFFLIGRDNLRMLLKYDGFKSVLAMLYTKWCLQREIKETMANSFILTFLPESIRSWHFFFGTCSLHIVPSIEGVIATKYFNPFWTMII